jgi:hypothetical protein
LNLNLLWSKKSAIVTITEAGEVLETSDTGESQRTRTRIIRYVKTCGQISRNPMRTVTVRRSHQTDYLASQGLCPPYFRGICQKSIRPNNRFVPYSRKSFERIVDCLRYNHFCLCAVLFLHLISFVTEILIFLIKSNY